MVDVASSVYYGHYDKLKVCYTIHTQAIYCHKESLLATSSSSLIELLLYYDCSKILLQSTGGEGTTVGKI